MVGCLENMDFAVSFTFCRPSGLAIPDKVNERLFSVRAKTPRASENVRCDHDSLQQSLQNLRHRTPNFSLTIDAGIQKKIISKKQHIIVT